MPTTLKFGQQLMLHTVIGVTGTAGLETTIAMMIHPQTLAGLLWREWTLNVLCAALVGFFVWRIWKVDAAIWVWIPSVGWFGLGLIFTLWANHNHSVLVNRGLWTQLSGAACDEGVHALGCRSFFLFTIVLIKGVSYSAGAYISFLITRTMAQSRGVAIS